MSIIVTLGGDRLDLCNLCVLLLRNVFKRPSRTEAKFTVSYFFSQISLTRHMWVLDFMF